MALQVSQALTSIRHSLGRALSSQLSPTGMLNEAGRYLTSMQKWRWLERPYVQLDELAPIPVTAATWTEVGFILTATAPATAFANYTYRGGDRFNLTAGTNATVGQYAIASKTSSTAIVFERSVGALANGSTNLAGSISFPYLQLPADFREIIDLRPTAGLLNGVNLTTLAELSAYRFSSISVSGLTRYVALSYQPVGGTGGPPVPRLEVYPTPTAAAFGVLSLMYRAGWTTVASDQDFLSIPEWIETLYLQIARAFARGYEEEDQGSLDTRLATIRLGPAFAAAQAEDAQMEPSLGPILNGAVGDGRVYHTHYASSIAGPS